VKRKKERNMPVIIAPSSFLANTRDCNVYLDKNSIYESLELC
jgi:hypothetical protein